MENKDDTVTYRYMVNFIQFEINLKDLSIGQHFMGRSLLVK